MADITLNATGPTPASLSGKSNGDVISIENSVGEEVGMDWDNGLFVPNRGTQPADSIADGGSVNYKLGAATGNNGKSYEYSWGPKRGMKTGTIVVD